jgi:hypothetical protein
MALRGRLDRVTRRLAPNLPGGPLTVVLVEATADRPAGERRRTNSAGLPVVEVAFDPAGGPAALPPPYKLVQGADPVDLV